MSWSLSSSGTTAALTIGTETALVTDTTNATYVLEVDTSAMALGDLLEIRLYTVTVAGGALVQAWKGSYQHAQVNNHKISLPVASDQSIRCTLKQAAGTGRAFPWKLLRI